LLVPPPHTPAVHFSPEVQAFPSLQVTPSLVELQSLAQQVDALDAEGSHVSPVSTTPLPHLLLLIVPLTVNVPLPDTRLTTRYAVSVVLDVNEIDSDAPAVVLLLDARMTGFPLPSEVPPNR
jgi:hypothetical protein